jgi:futalosine hydrolase
MNLLIVSATKLEVSELFDAFNFDRQENEAEIYISHKYSVSLLITGVGIANMSFELARHLLEFSYDLVINAGIGGAFHRKMPIGSLCRITYDEFADLGLETPNGLTTIFEAGFAQSNQFPYQNGKISESLSHSLPELEELPKFTGITVNTAHTNPASVDFFTQKYTADIETMEGAAFFLVCCKLKVQAIQIRAISNYVAPRNLACWNIQLAVKNLTTELIRITNSLSL